MKKILLSSLLILSINSFSQNKILFDATKAQSAGNADWVIDADNHNLGWGSTGGYIGGTDSNAQRTPTPAQSGITATTPETYWNGALSYWAIDCVKKGYQVETLPFGTAITYGTTNVQDLSNYKVFVMDEPNILYTAAEKTAIMNFVANGGGLFMISDHDVSDRNNDGEDSPMILNDLMSNNTVQANPFGISFDITTFSGTFSNIISSSTDPLLHGTAGNVTQVMWSSGTSMTLNKTQNTTVKGVVYRNSSSVTAGVSNVLCAYGNYGNGKFVGVGDSSIPDDGTGDSNDTLYDGYITDANGNHQRLLMNAMIWLMTSSTLNNNNFDVSDVNFVAYPNPTDNKQVNLSYSLSNNETATLSIYDALGRLVIEKTNNETSIGRNNEIMNLDNLQSGMYICKLSTDSFNKSIQLIVR